MLIFEDIKLMFEESSVNYDETLLFKLFCKVGLSIVMLQGLSRESSLRVFLKSLHLRVLTRKSLLESHPRSEF